MRLRGGVNNNNERSVRACARQQRESAVKLHALSGGIDTLFISFSAATAAALIWQFYERDNLGAPIRRSVRAKVRKFEVSIRMQRKFGNTKK